MRTTVTLDDELVAKAVALTGCRDRGPLLRAALNALIERESGRRLGPVWAVRKRRDGAASPQGCDVILADTSIWIDHFRNNNEKLAHTLLAEQVTCHPFIIAEIALGSLRNRSVVLGLLDDLPSLPVVLPGEVRVMIETRRLFSRGIGYVDASLLASCLVVPGRHTLDTRPESGGNRVRTRHFRIAGLSFHQSSEKYPGTALARTAPARFKCIGVDMILPFSAAASKNSVASSASVIALGSAIFLM